nr:ankyrin repeat protein [Pandoravirus massiliensis]
MAHSEQDNIFGHIPPEVASLILAHLDDRSFWMARRAHRVFRLDHTASDAQRRVAYWWLRKSAEQAIARGRADVLLFLQKRKRIPRNFSPWQAVDGAGHARALEAALAVFPADFGRLHTDGAVAAGHTDLVLRMHSLREFSIADSICAALRAERTGMALALCRAAAVKDWAAWACIAARHGHIACLQLFLDRCRTQRPTPTNLATEAVYAKFNERTGRTFGFLVGRFPNSVKWDRVFDVALERERADICAMARVHASSSLDLQSRLEQASADAHGPRVRILLQLDPMLCLQRALDSVARRIDGKCLAHPSTVAPNKMDVLCALVEADPARTLDARRAFETFRDGGMIGHAAYLAARYSVYHKL